MQSNSNGQLVQQPYLKIIGLIILITSVNMTGPLATDMYLPAFKDLLIEFNTTEKTLNFTLVSFAVTFAIGMLIFGPFSDKYGRKKILITGIIFYILSSFLCSMAQNVEQLILYRILQALGGGCMVSVSTAMIKDSFEGDARIRILATVQSLGVFAPMIAPLLGAQILIFGNWRTTFVVLALISCLSLCLAFFLKETHLKDKRFVGSTFENLKRLGVVAQNKAFLYFLFITALPSIIYMGFIAISSYIYTLHFNVTTTEYSVFFAINSSLLILGPFSFVKLSQKVQQKTILIICLSLLALGGILVMAIGQFSPYAFLICFAPITLGCGLIRPFATNILLEQQDSDTGTAASLINFTNTMFGSTGMIIANIAIFNQAFRLGFIAFIVSLLAYIGWYFFNKSGLILKGVSKA